MFPIIVLFLGIFMLWVIATGKAYQIVQVLRRPVGRRPGSSNPPLTGRRR